MREEDKKDCQVWTRLTKEDFEWFKKEADYRKRSRSDLLRYMFIIYKRNIQAGGSLVYEMTKVTEEQQKNQNGVKS